MPRFKLVRVVRNRILAAVVGLAIVLPAILYGGVWAAVACAAVVLVVGIEEYARMAAPEDKGALLTLMVTGVALFSTLLWAPAGWLAPVLVGCTLLCLLYGMFMVTPVDAAATTSARLIAGLLYFPLLWSFIIEVRMFDDGLIWLLVVLVSTWMGDTGAFFAGRSLGRHKLFARISPKKTWEGVVGGVLASVLGVCLIKALALPTLGWVHAVGLGALLPCMGVLGDLIESMFKRAYGVKDSGWILPGHGGILDRVDGLLLTAPTLWIYVTLFGLV